MVEDCFSDTKLFNILNICYSDKLQKNRRLFTCSALWIDVHNHSTVATAIQPSKYTKLFAWDLFHEFRDSLKIVKFNNSKLKNFFYFISYFYSKKTAFTCTFITKYTSDNQR